MFNKLKHLISQSEKLQVKHFLYLWFFSVIAFLTVYFVFNYGTETEPEDAWIGKNIPLSLSFYGFIMLGALSFCISVLLSVINTITNTRLHKSLKVLFLILVFSIIGVVSYRFGFEEGKNDVEFELTREEIKYYCALATDDGEQQLPACVISGCPEYRYWNGQSIVLQPQGANRGIAEVWILKDDEVVYRSDVEYGMSYEINEDGSGITLNYITEYDESGINPKTWESKKVIYSEESGEWTEQSEKNLNNALPTPDASVSTLNLS